MEKKFKISKDIYKEKEIRQAIIDFEGTSVIKFNNFELTITGNNDEEINEIFNELMNYIIYLINE